MAKLPYLVALAKIEEDRREKSIMIISGTVEPAKGIEKNIKETTLINLILESYGKENEL